MTNLQKASLRLLKKNRRKFNSFQYTVPSPTTYPYQWLWDSCFHAIILSHFNTEDAKKEILSVVSRQFDNGMIPHMIYWRRVKYTTFPFIKWGATGTSTITQPPMLAYAIQEILKRDNDIEFLKSVYPSLYRFYKYLLTERDHHKKHLISIINPDESGEDNSPRFDLLLGLPPKHTLKENTERRMDLVAQNIECQFNLSCMRNFFWVKDVSFNAIMVVNLKLLAKLAEEIGNKKDSVFFTKEAENISTAMRKFMLDQGIFYSIYGENNQKIKIKTWDIFTPLFAQMLSQDEAKKLVNDHLLNTKEFWTDFPVPTVSMDEEPFDPKGFWRGPAWIGTNWFIYKGLLNYGFKGIAEKIKESSEKLLTKSGFREYFDPYTAEGLGGENFTWGGLVVDMRP